MTEFEVKVWVIAMVLVVSFGESVGALVVARRKAARAETIIRARVAAAKIARKDGTG